MGQDWINVEDEKPRGRCLVYLECEVAMSIMHTAYFDDDVEIVGNFFAWDMPKILFWQPLPEPPKFED